MPFAVVCNLKSEFYSVRFEICTIGCQFLRDVMHVQRHQKLRHATATCEVSVPISTDIGTLVPRLLTGSDSSVGRVSAPGNGRSRVRSRAAIYQSR